MRENPKEAFSIETEININATLERRRLLLN